MTTYRANKALDRQTACIEIYEHDQIVAEVFLNEQSRLRFFAHETPDGLDWDWLCSHAAAITDLWHKTNGEMAAVRIALGEN